MVELLNAGTFDRACISRQTSVSVNTIQRIARDYAADHRGDYLNIFEETESSIRADQPDVSIDNLHNMCAATLYDRGVHPALICCHYGFSFEDLAQLVDKRITEHKVVYASRGIDYGKILALHNAHWSAEAISYDTNIQLSVVQEVIANQDKYRAIIEKRRCSYERLWH